METTKPKEHAIPFEELDFPIIKKLNRIKPKLELYLEMAENSKSPKLYRHARKMLDILLEYFIK